jgi:hypothetical protein
LGSVPEISDMGLLDRIKVAVGNQPRGPEEVPRPTGATGTSAATFIARAAGTPSSDSAAPDGAYFVIRIHAAQAVFRGRRFKKARNLVVTTTGRTDHRAHGSEFTSIHAVQDLRRNQPERIAINRDVVALTPTTMRSMFISVAFLVDEEDQIRKVARMINAGAMAAAIGLGPHAVAAAKAADVLARGVLNAFVTDKQREPILQFAKDFTIPAGDVRDGFYVIFCTTDPKNPLPADVSTLTVTSEGVGLGGDAVANLSYVVLDLKVILRRGQRGGSGPWKLIFDQIDRTLWTSHDLSTLAKKEAVLNNCAQLLLAAQALLQEDDSILPAEVEEIVAAEYAKCAQRIFGSVENVAGEPSMKAVTGLSTPAELKRTLRSYIQLQKESKVRVRQYEASLRQLPSSPSTETT